MKKTVRIILSAGVIAVSQLVGGCCNCNKEDFTFKQELFASAINLDGEGQVYSAEFGETENSVKTKYFSETKASLSVSVNGQVEYAQGYSCFAQLIPNQMIGNPGDEIEITLDSQFTTRGATFTFPDNSTNTLTADAPSYKFNLPAEFKGTYVVKGKSQYTQGDATYVSEGQIEILDISTLREETIIYSNMNIKVGGSFEIPYGNVTKWESSDPGVAKVDGTKITGVAGGTTVMRSISGKSFMVTVEDDAVTLFRQPCLDWGCDISQVKSYMDGYIIDGETEEDGRITLKYEMKDLAFFIYTFTDGGLSDATVLCGCQEPEKAQAFIKKNYVDTFVEQDGIHIYLTKDGKTVVGVIQILDIIYEFVYIPATKSSDLTIVKEAYSNDEIQSLLGSIGK